MVYLPGTVSHDAALSSDADTVYCSVVTKRRSVIIFYVLSGLLRLVHPAHESGGTRCLPGVVTCGAFTTPVLVLSTVPYVRFVCVCVCVVVSWRVLRLKRNCCVSLFCCFCLHLPPVVVLGTRAPLVLVFLSGGSVCGGTGQRNDRKMSRVVGSLLKQSWVR